jgi:hypothetical protein
VLKKTRGWLMMIMGLKTLKQTNLPALSQNWGGFTFFRLDHKIGHLLQGQFLYGCPV